MYPPQGQYIRLPTDLENDYEPIPSRKARLANGLRRNLQPITVFRAVSLLIAVALAVFWVTMTFIYPPFVFNEDDRPSWLDVPPPRPLRLRVAVISHTSEFNLRMILRETVLWGVPKSDVDMVFRFFVGRLTGRNSVAVGQRLEQEMERYGDIVMLKDIDDIKERISEKRFAALKWVSCRPFNIPGNAGVLKYSPQLPGGIGSPRKL